eukprot:m.980026 g.980026  ORF g.980026 m.980026 type:complete len:65 (+) comp23963_c0_seq4:49-243(+)
MGLTFSREGFEFPVMRTPNGGLNYVLPSRFHRTRDHTRLPIQKQDTFVTRVQPPAAAKSGDQCR